MDQANISWPGSRSRRFFLSFLKYSFGYVPSLLENVLGLWLLSPQLSNQDFTEWAIYEAVLVIFVSWAQLGTKFGYMQFVAQNSGESRSAALKFVLRVNTLGSLAFGFGVWGIFIVWQELQPSVQWINGTIIWLTPLIILATNLFTIAQTDARITHNIRQFVILLALKAAIYMLALWVLLKYATPLTAHYCALILSLSIVYVAWRVRQTLSEKEPGLSGRRTVLAAARGAWLGPAKYFADFAIPFLLVSTMGASWSSEFGKALRVLLPFEGLVSVAFLLTWGSYVYHWNEEDPSGEKTRRQVLAVWPYVVLGGGFGLGCAAFVWWLTALDFDAEKSFFVLLSLWARKLAFFCYFPASYGFIIRRHYFSASLIGILELGVTLAVLLWISNPVWLFTALAVVPWGIVWLTYRMSTSRLRALN